MEEKKTKKMTKAEAFEYLKGKKVLCYSSKMEAVQCFVKSLGFHWSDYSEEPMLVSALFLGKDGRLTYSVSLKWFKEHESQEISVDDILSIEIVEEEDTSMPTVEFERYVKILQAWSKRINSSFVFSERGMGIVRGDLLTKLEGEEKGAYYKMEVTL